MTRPVVAADAAQILVNLAWIPNPPNETEDSIIQRLEVPNSISVIDDDSKSVVMAIVYPDVPEVKVIWWIGPPESHFPDRMVALTGWVEVILGRWPMSRPWRFFGDTADKVLAARWVDEVRERDGPAIVTVGTSPNNFRHFEGESTIGEVARALGVHGGA